MVRINRACRPFNIDRGFTVYWFSVATAKNKDDYFLEYTETVKQASAKFENSQAFRSSAH